MPLSKEQKTEVLKGLSSDMKDAKSVVFSKFHGLSVSKITELRNQLRENNIKYRVAKKTLIRLAAKENGLKDIPDESMVGSVSIAFGMEDEISAAKMIHEFSKKHKGIELLGSILDGKILSIEETKALATLPGKEELIAKFMFIVKYPIQGFHGVLTNTVSSFVRVLDRIKEQKTQ